MSPAFVLIRLHRRVREPAAWIRLAGLLALALVAFALHRLGQDLRPAWPAGHGAEVAERVTAGFLFLVVGLLTSLVGFVSTAGFLLRDGQEEMNHLLALPITLRDLARARLVETLLEGLQAGAVLSLWLLAAATGLWGAGLSGLKLLLLGAMALGSAFLCTGIGALVVLLVGKIVPVRAREVAVLLAVITTLAWGAVGSTQLAAVLGRGRIDAAADLLRYWLAPLHLAQRVGGLIRGGGLAAVGSVAAFFFVAAALVWTGTAAWTRLLRSDLEAQARRQPPVEHSASPGRPRSVTEPSPPRRWLDPISGLLPSPAGALLIRDLRAASRLPAVRIRTVALAAALLTTAFAPLPFPWVLWLLYMAPGELARDALLRSLEEDRENHFCLRVTSGDLVGYLRLRLTAGWLAIFPLSVLLWLALSLLSPKIGLAGSGAVIRPLLLVVAGWLAVWTNLAVTTFGRGGSPSTVLCSTSPAALPVMGAGAVVAGACLLVDRALLDQGAAPWCGLSPTLLGGIAAALLVIGLLASTGSSRRLAARWEGWSQTD